MRTGRDTKHRGADETSARILKAVERTQPLCNELAPKIVGLNGLELMVMAAYILRAYDHTLARGGVTVPREKTLAGLGAMVDAIATVAEPVSGNLGGRRGPSHSH